MGFVANLIRFPAVQKVWKSVSSWQSYREFKGGDFETQCSYKPHIKDNFLPQTDEAKNPWNRFLGQLPQHEVPIVDDKTFNNLCCIVIWKQPDVHT